MSPPYESHRPLCIRTKMRTCALSHGSKSRELFGLPNDLCRSCRTLFHLLGVLNWFVDGNSTAYLKAPTWLSKHNVLELRYSKEPGRCGCRDARQTWPRNWSWRLGNERIPISTITYCFPCSDWFERRCEAVREAVRGIEKAHFFRGHVSCNPPACQRAFMLHYLIAVAQQTWSKEYTHISRVFLLMHFSRIW